MFTGAKGGHATSVPAFGTIQTPTTHLRIGQRQRLSLEHGLAVPELRVGLEAVQTGGHQGAAAGIP